MDTLFILVFSISLISGFLTSGGNIEPLWFGSSGLSSLVAGLAVTPIVGGLWIVYNRRSVRFEFYELVIPLVLLFSVFFAPYTINPHIHITQAIVWFAFWLIAVILTKLFRKSVTIKQQASIYALVSALIMLAFSLFKAVINNELRFGVHISGEFGLHNSYAAAAMLACSIAIAAMIQWYQPLMISSNDKNAIQSKPMLWHTVLAVSTLILGLTGIFFSQSRGVWLCTGLLFLLLSLYAFTTTIASKHKLVVGLSLLALVVIVVLIPGPFKQHVKNAFNPEDFSVKGRIRFHEVAAKMAVTPPLAGFGNYRFRYPSLQQDPNYYATDPHNLYVQMLAEGQVLGGVLLLGLVISVIWALMQTRQYAPYQVVAGFGLLALAIHLAIDFDFTFTTNGLLFALLWALWQAPKSPENTIVFISAGSKFINLSMAGLAIASGLFMISNLTAIQLVRSSENENVNNREQLARVATVISPIDQKTWTALAVVSSDKDTSLKAFSKVNVLSPWDARGWNNSANAGKYAIDKSNSRQVEQTVQMFLKAIQCDPVNRPYLYSDLAEFYSELGREADQLEIIRSMLLAFNWPEPITPAHPRPQWVYYNQEMLTAMKALVRLEDKLGQKSNLYAVCKSRIPTFEVYISKNPVPD